MATPKLTTYFKTFTTDALGQIFMTGILDVSTTVRSTSKSSSGRTQP